MFGKRSATLGNGRELFWQFIQTTKNMIFLTGGMRRKFTYAGGEI